MVKFFFLLFWIINNDLSVTPIKENPLDFPIWNLKLLSKTAPKDYLSANKEKFPDWSVYFTLENSNLLKLPPGKYIKNNSELIIYDNGIFQWFLPDGTIFDSRTDGYKSIEKNGYKYELLGKICEECKGKSYLYYPDGSRLEKYNHPVSQRIEFNYYNLMDDGLHTFTIYEPGYWEKNYKKKYNLQIYYSDSWEMYIEKFLESYIKFTSFMDKEFKFFNPGIIPIVLLEDKETMQRFLNLKKVINIGGHAGIHSILLCCGNLMRIEKEVKEYNDLFSSIGTNYLIYHELVHNFQQNKCIAIKRTKLEGNNLNLPIWFTEGIAVFVAMQMDNSIKKIFIKEFINIHKYPKYKKLSNFKYGSKEVYIIGGMVLEFISKNYGNTVINEIHNELCSGNDSDDVVFRQLGYETGELFMKSIEYFKESSIDE